MSTEDAEWLAQLEQYLRADIDRPLRRETIKRLWELRLLTDRDCDFLLSAQLCEPTERQATAIHLLKLRLLVRLQGTESAPHTC